MKGNIFALSYHERWNVVSPRQYKITRTICRVIKVSYKYVANNTNDFVYILKKQDTHCLNYENYSIQNLLT